MALRRTRDRMRLTQAPLVCPVGGQPLTSSPELFAPVPTGRAVEITVGDVALQIRSVRPADALAVDRFFASLSSQTAYRRFHAPVSRLTADQLAGVIDVDHRERETLVALVPGARSPEIVGVAQYIVVGDEVADMAIVVADRWQRRGIGRALSEQLGEAAAEAGIVRFEATVLADNPAPQRLARAAARVDAVHDGTTVDLHIAVCEPDAARIDA